MRKVILIICLMSLASVTQARSVLIDGGDSANGGFGGPQFGVTRFNGDTEILAGGGGAWLINHQFYLGGRGSGVATRLAAEDVEFGYGGLWAGYIFKPDAVVNMSFDILVGGGGLHKSESGSYGATNRVFVVEPALSMRINMAKYMSTAIGAAYRYVEGSDHAVLTDSALRGASAYVRFEFGKF